MKKNKGTNIIAVAIVGAIIVSLVLVLGTVFTGQSARNDTEDAVHSVSLLYLDELAGRREQVVSSNLQRRTSDLQTAISLMTEDDLSDVEHLQNYQARMKKLYTLEKFAFVDETGLIYTSLGLQTNIDEYSFDYKTISKPEISIFNLNNAEKKVIIAIPVNIPFENTVLSACFMEIDMAEMLSGVSMQSGADNATFCNIYTKDGVALTNTVLGGLASEDNLLDAMKHAEFESGYDYDKFITEFTNSQRGEISFTYNGIQETLSYVSVSGTDWVLTYLIRESVIADNISSISSGIVLRSFILSAIAAALIIAVFIFILLQQRKNSKLLLEKEKAEVESKTKQEQLSEQLKLQNELLEEEKQRSRQSQMITALSADYWSVYYIELDKNEGVCYQSHEDIENGLKTGDSFDFQRTFTDYANRYVTENYREEFLNFIHTENIKEGLKASRVISFRYTVNRHEKESYEMVRFAGVRHPEDRNDGIVHAIGACFTNVDEETRKDIAQSEALSNALNAAEQANKAKTAFLSNMSHEIRTPMNAIIGLDNIALNDPEISVKTKDYLTKIGDSAEHLLQLINDILDMSRIESGRMTLKNEEFSFSKLLEYINTMFSGQCTDKGLEYNCSIEGHIDDYYIGDSMKLRQVLINILGNAVKFTPTGGMINFSVERTAEFDGKSALKFKISDNGIGISEEFLPHIFDTFTQEDSSASSKYGSSGLGLAITKNIVEMMNGNIEVQSRKNEGTTFTVFVTLRNSERKGSDDDNEINPQEMTVLVIDDDPVACEHAKLVLEKVGISAEIATSGDMALEMVKLRHARREPYNLILVDWKMPDKDGVQTCREIRSVIGKESAIIMLTAYKWDEVLDEAMNAGIDSFIAKPLFAANVLDEYKGAVKRKDIASGTKNDNENILEGKKILIAEDVEINAEIIQMVLQMRNMEAEIAGNGRIAVEMFSEKPAGYYSAILMDMRMPEMDGLEATRAIRSLSREDAKTIPIIALTANAFDEDVNRSLQAGMNAHLSKPVDPDKLFDTLKDFISKIEE